MANNKQAATKKRSRIKVGKLQKITAELTKAERKKVKGGVQSTGLKEIALGDGSVRGIKQSDIQDGTSNTITFGGSKQN